MASRIVSIREVYQMKRRQSAVGKKKEEPADDEPLYTPRGGSEPLMRERPVSSPLTKRLRVAFDEYCKRHKVKPGECVRLLIAHAIKHDLNPWQE